MARFDFRLPDIGEGITEGEIVSWHVKPGDKVAEDQIMVEVMTDKATVTIGAPRAGTVADLLADAGHVVRVGDVIVVIETGNGSRTSAQMPAASAVGDIQDSLPGTAYFGERRAVAAASHAASTATLVPGPSPVPKAAARTSPRAPGEKPLATPATRRLARDLDVDLETVEGTGDGGRITVDDVRRASSAGTVTAVPAPVPTPASADVSGGGRRIPFIGLRRKIAERMQTAKNTAAHFTFVEECDVDRLVEVREHFRPVAEKRGVELSYLPFIIKAVVAALREHPMLNATLDNERGEIVQHDAYNIGVAAATDQGLVVPVVHDADQLDLFELAAEIDRLAKAARAGKLTVKDLSGSTFTVTSLGKQSGYFATPILNFPNSAILGIHRIKERPVVRGGQIVIGRVMLLSLSFDHRIVDGHVGAAFAYDVIERLQEPAMLFAGV